MRGFRGIKPCTELIHYTRHMGVSANRGPEYRTLNSRILILGTPKVRYPLILGNSDIHPLARNFMNSPLQGGQISDAPAAESNPCLRCARDLRGLGFREYLEDHGT